MKEKLAKSIEYKSKGRWVVNFSHRSSFYEFVKFIRDVSGLPIYSKVKGGLGYNLSMENPVQLNELLESLVVLVNLNGYEIIAQDDTFVVIDK